MCKVGSLVHKEKNPFSFIHLAFARCSSYCKISYGRELRRVARDEGDVKEAKTAVNANLPNLPHTTRFHSLYWSLVPFREPVNQWSQVVRLAFNPHFFGYPLNCKNKPQMSAQKLFHLKIIFTRFALMYNF